MHGLMCVKDYFYPWPRGSVPLILRCCRPPRPPAKSLPPTTTYTFRLLPTSPQLRLSGYHLHCLGGSSFSSPGRLRLAITGRHFFFLFTLQTTSSMATQIVPPPKDGLVLSPLSEEGRSLIGFGPLPRPQTDSSQRHMTAPLGMKSA